MRGFAEALGETRKYHETMTVGWARLVGRLAVDSAPLTFPAFVAAHPELLRRDLLRVHYSRELQLRFTEVLRALPSGVCVVSAMGPGGPAGLTASSVSSLSLDPLLRVVGIRSSSQTLAAARAAGSFAINVLAADQAGVALRFASPRAGRDKYAGVHHRIQSGAPVIDEAAAWLVCELRASHPEGDHALVVGRVCAMGRHANPRRPLVTHGGRLTTVAETAPAAQP